ncbi:hypothetical protein D8674_002282 [Pyrus ussuriensis x Pyrus communis]|uniref:Uncharacterized protein n=1 Tax=Pyrus ussuriensis x Pyrus communis TaxID=2448454 RepID=A0A5N5FE88_9ROSA|nr:hypothetical protein D8674_002282 [Pyrus ussuriensis x Pyrus communis]
MPMADGGRRRQRLMAEGGRRRQRLEKTAEADGRRREKTAEADGRRTEKTSEAPPNSEVSHKYESAKPHGVPSASGIAKMCINSHR